MLFDLLCSFELGLLIIWSFLLSCLLLTTSKPLLHGHFCLSINIESCFTQLLHLLSYRHSGRSLTLLISLHMHSVFLTITLYSQKDINTSKMVFLIFTCFLFLLFIVMLKEWNTCFMQDIIVNIIVQIFT